RKQRAGKEEKSRQGRSGRSIRAPAPNREPKRNQQRQGAGREKILPAAARIDRPMGIDENEIRRAKQFRKIEPNHPARHETALRHAQLKAAAAGADDIALHPGGKKAGGSTEREPG